MKKKLCIICGIIISAVMALSGCKLIETQASNSLTVIFDDEGIDYNSFSEPAKQALYEINTDHFFEATEGNADDVADMIQFLNKLFSKATSNALEVSALTNAAFEDLIIQYDINSVNANAESVYYALEKYCNECAANGISVKSGVHINKIASKPSGKSVKYNGKNSDMKLFINNVINNEARNGYYYVNINEFGAPLAVYWAEEKSDFANDDNLVSYYTWDIEEYQNGEDVIGVYPGTFSVCNTTSVRVAQRTSLSSELDLSSVNYGGNSNKTFYNNIVNTFKEDIDDAINGVNSSESKTSEVTYTKEQIKELISASNANAKQVHTALAACATQAGIINIKIESAEITNNYDGDTNLLFGDYDPDLVAYLGENFKGYYYVYLNPDTYSVYFALWSEQPIPDSYKYQFTEDEQEKLWAKGVEIGCYPYALDSESAFKYSYNNNNISNLSVQNAVDPFDGLEIQYDGASPYLKASINTAKCSDNVRKYVTFSVTDESLKKGDNITVKADWDEKAMSGTEISFSSESKDYVVDNVAYYLDSLDGVDLSELDQLMDDFVEAEANKGVNDSVILGKSSKNEAWYNGEQYSIGYSPVITGIGSVNAVNKYFLSMKQSSSLSQDKIYNKYICIYEVTYTTYRKSTDETANNTAVIAVFMENIVIGSDGNLRYHSTEPLNSKLLFYKAEDTVSIIESNYIIAEKAQYNVTQIK